MRLQSTLAVASWISCLSPSPPSVTGLSLLNSSSSSNSSSNPSRSRSMTRSMETSTTDATTTTTTSGSVSGGGAVGPMDSIVFDNSWPHDLSPETEDNLRRSLDVEGLVWDGSGNYNHNRRKRPVFNGHYVPVPPTGLADPRRVLVSDDVASGLLHLTPAQVGSDDFLQYVSGNLSLPRRKENPTTTNDVATEDENTSTREQFPAPDIVRSWATPYALSIMGTRYTSNCPYGTGNGYGDGRAISIGEFHGYELQLKGAGTTPFHRGADGRAVLRSSIREFLASEAMYHLGIDTTRALSLVVSGTDTVQRPWYSEGAVLQIPSLDDVRLAQYSLEQRRQIIQQLRTTQKADPNILVREPCAITCRVSTSFVRIGHIDLFARRVERRRVEDAAAAGSKGSSSHGQDRHGYDTSTLEWRELEQIIWHACKREYRDGAYGPYIESKNIAGAADKFLELAAPRIAAMVSGWVRVGFAQGNFNADNCLVGGKTMDYGPFGWMEEYAPLFAKWTGSGEHFGFMNQPNAGLANYQVLVESVVPVIAVAQNRGGEVNDDDNDDDDGDDATDPEALAEQYMAKAKTVFEREMNAVFNVKLGLPKDADAGDDLWTSLQPLLVTCRTDWTIFWRQLTYVMRDVPDLNSADYEAMMDILEGEEGSEQHPFYEPLTPAKRREWIEWIKDWREVLKASKVLSTDVYETMRTSNPKFVLREWMLVDAYTAAANGEYTPLNELFELIQQPYEEGTSQQVAAYYRRAPESTIARGGTAFMS